MIRVPVGTTVWVGEGRDRVALGDLTEPGAEVIVARGGNPGRGNRRFATATNQEPLLAEVGEDGEERTVSLEVRLLADVGLVGGPNAGKSTLLSALSRARPKVAPYPFTTVEPVVGTIERGGRQIAILDVPGLIEGAHMGRGLGLDFLRHVERVDVLVHVVDGNADAAAAYTEIERELAAYGHGLEEKPRVVALTKIDLPEVRADLEAKVTALEAVSGLRVMAISGVTGEGTGALVDAVTRLVPMEDEGWDEAVSPVEQATPAPEVERQRKEVVAVEREDGVYVVRSRQAERFAPLVNFNNWRARMQFHAELERLGVIEELRRAGASSGDTVRIAGRDLEWE